MNNFEYYGYEILPQAIALESIDLLNRAIEEYTKNKAAYGIRNLHLKIPAVANLAESEAIKNILRKYTNCQELKLIKAILFNKNLEHNWSVPWHQDKTIAVKNKVILSGYKNWTIKQGVPHVQPPRKILEKIITTRIVLDNTDDTNGALKIIPRSHKLGILNQAEINILT